MIFIDASLPRTVADELKKVREDVVFKHDIFPPGTDDSVWLRRVGREEWLAITHDKHVRTRYGERAAIMEKPAIVRMVFDYLPEMERRFATTPRPFIYTVSKNGEFKEYAQRRLRTPPPS